MQTPTQLVVLPSPQPCLSFFPSPLKSYPPRVVRPQVQSMKPSNSVRSWSRRRRTGGISTSARWVARAFSGPIYALSPASISAITKEFMEDLGLDTLENLAPYTLGTEVGGLNGNFSDAEGSGLNFDDTLRAVTPNIRVRGLAPTRTRETISYPTFPMTAIISIERKFNAGQTACYTVWVARPAL